METTIRTKKMRKGEHSHHQHFRQTRRSWKWTTKTMLKTNEIYSKQEVRSPGDNFYFLADVS